MHDKIQWTELPSRKKGLTPYEAGKMHGEAVRRSRHYSPDEVRSLVEREGRSRDPWTRGFCYGIQSNA